PRALARSAARPHVAAEITPARAAREPACLALGLAAERAKVASFCSRVERAVGCFRQTANSRSWNRHAIRRQKSRLLPAWANESVGALAEMRSEERRVGKECRYQWSADH